MPPHPRCLNWSFYYNLTDSVQATVWKMKKDINKINQKPETPKLLALLTFDQDRTEDKDKN